MDPLIEELTLPYLFVLSFSIVVSTEIKEFAPLEANSILYEYCALKCLSCCGKLHDKVLSLSVDPISVGYPETRSHNKLFLFVVRPICVPDSSPHTHTKTLTTSFIHVDRDAKVTTIRLLIYLNQRAEISEKTSRGSYICTYSYFKTAVGIFSSLNNNKKSRKTVNTDSTSAENIN